MTARKVMLLGEIGVGKSSLVRRLVFDRFDTDYKPTLGVDVYRYEVPPHGPRPALTLIIWDTDGNFGESLFRHVYMREASAAFILGDVTRRHTLESMLKLSKGFREAFPGRHDALVVNKIDLLGPDDPALPGELGADRKNVYHTSAMTGENVQRAFHEAADTLLRRGL